LNKRTHPSVSYLAGYAAGELSAVPRIAISAHLETCAACRTRVLGYEEAEGRLLESLPPVALGHGALDRVVARLRSEAGAPPQTHPAPTHPTKDARRELPRAVTEAGVGRRRWLTPGLWLAPVGARTETWRTFLVHAPAGMTIPTHGHGADEVIALLEGAFHDGVHYAAGDFADNLAGSEHRLRVARDAPCLCLISMRGRPQWRGWARLIAPVLDL